MTIIIYRTIMLYIIIIIAFKMMGKRQVGELQPSELVITIMVSNIAALPIENMNIPLLSGIFPILILVSFEIIFSFICLKKPKFRKMITGSPAILILDGKIQQQNLLNLRFTLEDLIEELRLKDVFDISEVDSCIIETNGKISVYKKQEKDVVTKEDLQIEPSTKKPSFPIIVDGEINKINLGYCNLTEKWLNNIIEEKQIDIKNIFLLTADAQGQYKIVKREI